MGNSGGGGFSERSSATSIGAACGRLFRLRKTAMLSRHWRLWLSFPSLALPPEERLGIGLSFLSNLRAHERWARSFVFGLRSRRLTEPPRPANAGERTPPPAYGGRLPFQGRLCGKRRPKGSPAEGAVSRRLTEDKPALCKPIRPAKHEHKWWHSMK